MRERWMSILPESVACQGQFLGAFGIEETAWPVSDAPDIADLLRANGWAIVGGDLYRQNGNTFVPTYDNWSCEIATSEAWVSYVARSSVVARKFLSRFRESDCWATIVATAKPDAQQLVSSHVR
jgi:hypothetical protein